MPKEKSWMIPAWIASRSYFTGTEKARTIITNSRWATHLVLRELSSDMWSRLPDCFMLQTLKEPLAEVGIDLNDAEHIEEVENFLESLRQEGCLVLEGGENPTNNSGITATANSKKHKGEIRQIPRIKAAFDYDLSKEGVLTTIGIELTYRCVEKCVHCFNPKYSNGGEKALLDDELSTEEWKALIQEAHELGVNSIGFTGGEVFLRDDFFEILDEVKRLKIPFSISTNGQLLTEKIVRRLVDYYPATVSISIYSANPDTHDATTRVKGSFDKSIQALTLLRENGIGIAIKSPLMKHTVYGFKELLKLCDKLKARPQIDCTISPSTDGNQYVTMHQINCQEILEQLFREEQFPLYVGLETESQGKRLASVDSRPCGAGMMNLGICPNGVVYPCNSLPLELGNYRVGGLRKIWKESETLKAWNSFTMQDSDECGLYEKCLYCNCCVGLAMLEHNDLFRSHSASCNIAKVRQDVAKKLENNREPLDEYKKQHGKLFGYELKFEPPVSTDCTSLGMAEINLNFVNIDHSGGDFIEKMKHCKHNGNPIRQGKIYEPNSPEDLYHRGELRKENADEGRFTETGR